MKIGTYHFPTDYGIDVGELARALEARNFESLFVCEHTHIPASRRSPFPSGGESAAPSPPTPAPDCPDTGLSSGIDRRFPKP